MNTAEFLIQAEALLDGGNAKKASAQAIKTAPIPVLRELAGKWLLEYLQAKVRERTLAAEKAAVKKKVREWDDSDPYDRHNRIIQELNDHSFTERPITGAPGSVEWHNKLHALKDAAKDAKWEIELEERARWQKRRDELQPLIDQEAREAAIAWTVELLSKGFTLTDGTYVTWGAATIEQHRDRYDMFAGKAVAHVQGAARHLQAIQALEESGKTCLDELETST